MYPLEEGQIRSREDLQRTVKLAASGGAKLDPSAFKSLEDSGYFKGWLEGVEKEYTIPVEDFATPNIDKGRSKRIGHSKMKDALISEAGEAFKRFLNN